MTMRKDRKKDVRYAVRVEPPTAEEAIAAAQDLTTDPTQQVEIAASLIGIPEEDIRPLLARVARQATRQVTGGASRFGTVVVERKSRRIPGRG
jgi:hypothetical protein